MAKFQRTKFYPALGILILFLLMVSCQNQPSSDHSGHDHHEQGHSTESTEMAQMIRELDSLAKNGDPMNSYHWNLRRAQIYLDQFQKAENNQQKLLNWYQYNSEMLNAGEEQKVIAEIENFITQQNLEYRDLLKEGTSSIIELLALAYLRLGENENCRQYHNEYSCILPLHPEAQHKLTQGSEKAIELYTLLHATYPKDKYKWLLNVAYMTLGQHPQNVPPEHLINYPQKEPNLGNIAPFEEKATDYGIAVSGIAGGVCIDDFNGDGTLDLFTTSYWNSDQCRLFFNLNGQLKDVTTQAGLTGITSGLNCLHADYNNDGHIDILILRGGWLGAGGHHPNSLLQNQGDGTFKDVSRSSGLLSYHPTQTAVWGDVNNDGHLDLFIGNESRDAEVHPCEFFENQGNGTFLEKAEEYGLGDITGFVKGVDFSDINNDGWPDLFISVMGGENRLYLNQKGRMENIAAAAGVAEPIFSFPCWFWDVNQDGWQDIFISSYDVRYLNDVAEDFSRELQGKPVQSNVSRLFINNGDLTFTDRSKDYGLDQSFFAMGANYGDLDNDGYPDFYLGTGAPDFSTIVPNRMFRNVEGRTMEEVTTSGRFGHIQKGHGVSFSDLDQDGDQDIYAVMGGAFKGDIFTNVFFENPGQENNWIVIEVEGTTSNKGGIGTRIKITTEDGRHIFSEINTGGSFGANSLQAEIGLGRASSIRELQVTWPGGKTQRFENVAVNQKLKITEGDPEVEIKPYAPLTLQAADPNSGHHHH